MNSIHGIRNENGTVLLEDAIIGFGSGMFEEEMVLLENHGDGKLSDIETPTQYVINRRGQVTKTSLTPNCKDQPLKRTFTELYGLMPVIEVLEKSKNFFDTLEKKGYDQEISKIRGKFNLILSNIKNRPGRTPMSVSELKRIFEDLKQLYTYACSDLTTDKVKTQLLKPRDPNEEVSVSKLYLGTTRYMNNKSRNNQIGILELETYISEAGLTLYRDLRRNSHYYINESGNVVLPPNWVLGEYRVPPTLYELQRFISPVNAETAILNSEPKQRRQIFDKGDRQTFKGVMSSINAEKDGIMPFTATVRNIRDNMDFLLKCYATEIDAPCLYEQRYINLSHLITDVVEDISLLGLAPKDKVYNKQD